LIYCYLGFERLFRWSFLFIILLVPFVSSIFTIVFFPDNTNESVGFSGVVSGVFGLLGFSIPLYLIKQKAKKELAFLSIPLLILSLICFVYAKQTHEILYVMSVITFILAFVLIG